ncbi:MAG: hypothetical protein ABJD11_13330, partial [Gemmatimonadota bacterium]
MVSTTDQSPRNLPDRVAASLAARWRTLLASPLLNPSGRAEERRERAGHAVSSEHGPHLREAIGWLERAQDAVEGGGIARGYNIMYSKYFRGRSWQPAYPETTGYIIPTLLEAAVY